MSQAMSIALTLASLEITPQEQGNVLVFVENVASSLPVRTQSSMTFTDRTPDLVSFFVPREAAQRLVRGRRIIGKFINGRKIVFPSAHELVTMVVHIEDVEDPLRWCWHYMFLLARHRPASSLQYGLAIENDSFVLLSVGLDEQRVWQEVGWKDPNCVRKLYSCVKQIRDEATRTVHPAMPNPGKVMQVKKRYVAYYTAMVGGKQFRLLPIFSGRGEGRKSFVALAVEENNCDVFRVFKYSWNDGHLYLKEHKFLKRLTGTPGVVDIDDELSMDSLGTDEASGRTRSLLVLKTIGYPLCSCKTVLEFLEAMYDLLEVLRYLVEEKKILHRDISWSNVLLIRPDHKDASELVKDAVNLKDATPKLEGAAQRSSVEGAKDTDAGIPHSYRLISNIFNEPKGRIRVALADFDHASDLSASDEAELKDATGTPMFMANDVLSPSGPFRMTGSPRPYPKTLMAALGTCDDKYADAEEKQKWDEYYKNEATRLRWRMDPTDEDSPVEQSFKHGAVHDAESVFCLCVLFFTRMWPQGTTTKRSELYALEKGRGTTVDELLRKAVNVHSTRAFLDGVPLGEPYQTERLKPFHNMLQNISHYLGVPWYNVDSTGRGERYEFHLHDFMQRLLLKEIRRMREGDDHILVEENPLKVRTAGQHSGDDYTPCCKVILSSKRSRDESADPGAGGSNKHLKLPKGKTVQPDLGNHGGEDPVEALNPVEFVVPVDRSEHITNPSVPQMPFPSLFWEVYWAKKREKLWFAADML